MAKVIMTIAADDGMSVDEIMSFKTENYIGIWYPECADFFVMAKSDIEFNPITLGYVYGIYSDLREFDDKVFEKCGEHILEVFDKTNYTLTLEVD